MTRVSPNISRSVPSTVGWPARFFRYHSTALIGSGAARCTWSIMFAKPVCAETGIEQAVTMIAEAAIARRINPMCPPKIGTRVHQSTLIIPAELNVHCHFCFSGAPAYWGHEDEQCSLRGESILTKYIYCRYS